MHFKFKFWKKSYEITKAIAFFAKNAKIPCITEFVHNEAVQKLVEELGIEYYKLIFSQNLKPYLDAKVILNHFNSPQ